MTSGLGKFAPRGAPKCLTLFFAETAKRLAQEVLLANSKAVQSKRGDTSMKQSYAKAATVLGLGLVLIGWSKSGFADANIAPPKMVAVMPEYTFIPPGFDSNDSAQVIVAGDLLDSCHNIGPSTVRVDQSKNEVYITQQTYVLDGCWCVDISARYAEPINLGVLSSGTYKVFAVNDQGVARQVGTLGVAQARERTIDDYTYAPVQEMFLEPAKGGSPANLILRGNLNTDCLRIAAVTTLYRTPNLIEVLPLVEKIKDKTCAKVSNPFEERVVLKSPWSGRTLVHVRAMSGRSLNQVYDF